MKFPIHQPKTRQALLEWAHDSRSVKVLTPRFYLWRARNAEQRTILGFLRSSLYQLWPYLRQTVVTWLEQACHVDFTQDELDMPIWTVETMWKFHLHIFIKLSALDCEYCICFFVDGLDECEDE